MEYSEANKQRRAVNVFDPAVAIKEDELKRIFEEASLAPSSFNFQPWKVVIALSAKAKEGLKRAAFGQAKVTEASAVLVFFGNTKQYLESDDVFDDWVEKGYLKAGEVEKTKGMAKGLYGGREVAFVSRNVGLLAMNIMLAAKNRGWDTHPMDGFDIAAVKNLFGLDEKYLPVMLVAIGKKPSEHKLLPRALRRSFERTCEIR